MSVLLLNSIQAASADSNLAWTSIGDVKTDRAPGRQRHAGAALEIAFGRIAETWWRLGQEFSGTENAYLAHAPACVTNASDLGLMMAWADLISNWAAEPETTLVICDDPWMQRHLAHTPGVVVGKLSRLWPIKFGLALRGWMARSKVAVCMARAAMTMREQRRNLDLQPNRKSRPAIVVFGHPSSDINGNDAYFGDLMNSYPRICRYLHIDCPPARARELAKDGRTISLHAWGSILFALTLPLQKWRVKGAQNNFLIQRAESMEGSKGQAATLAWQAHCQKRWLRDCRPHVVLWPWENQSWERALALSARQIGIKSIGYQHSVIGPQMLNYAIKSNRSDTNDLPDHILCNGTATRNHLLKWGFHPESLCVAGALRFSAPQRVAYDPDAPVFMALPFDRETAKEMVSTARSAVADGFRFVVKSHPMTPYIFKKTPGIKITAQQLDAFEAVSAVVFASTTVGLEAALMGLPTLRFVPANRMAIDILPEEVEVPTTDSRSLSADLSTAGTNQHMPEWTEIFGVVDQEIWSGYLGASAADEAA